MQIIVITLVIIMITIMYTYIYIYIYTHIQYSPAAPRRGRAAWRLGRGADAPAAGGW